MSTAYVSGRVPARYERLVAKQARAARTCKSDLVARYVIEKTLGSGVPRHLVSGLALPPRSLSDGPWSAVWDVLTVYDEVKSIDRTAAHFRWPRVLVRRALTYARAFPEEIAAARKGETLTVPALS